MSFITLELNGELISFDLPWLDDASSFDALASAPTMLLSGVSFETAPALSFDPCPAVPEPSVSAALLIAILIGAVKLRVKQ